MTWREFKLAKSKKVQLWKIRQDGEFYETEHGQLDGQQQQFRDRPGDKGKPNTKAYLDPTANCTFHVDREIRKKLEHGYIEYINGQPATEQITSLAWDQHLPKNFCGYKPQTSIEPSALQKLHDTGLAKYTRKMDGMCHLAVHHTFGWEIYTRRMDLASAKFPKHLAELQALTDFKPGTILMGELVCSTPDGSDDFKAISRFCRSLPEEARKLIDDQEIPEPELVIFDLLFHNGEDQQNQTYNQRAEIWQKIIPARGSSKHISTIDYFDLAPATWEAYAKEHGYEGFVVVDGAAIPGDKFYSFDGSNSRRPKGTYKLKPIYEDDVCIFAASPGSGKRLNGIGAIHVKQIHPETKEWFYCGKVGSGFTDDSLAEMELLFKKMGLPILEKDKDIEKLDLSESTYDSIVAQIEYSERQPGTNKFRFPVYLRTRDDKAPLECIAQKLGVAEEE